MMEADAKRVLRHLARLRREGIALLRDRPLDEVAHAMWSDRADKYMGKEFPESRPRRPDELVEVQMPDLLDPTRPRSHPLDAAVARTEIGCQLMRRQLAVLASRAEQLELKMEQRKESDAEPEAGG
jgi:hypothetical protein